MEIKTQSTVTAAGLQHSPKRAFTRFQIVKNVFVICAGVLLLFTAYDGMTMLQSTMNREGGIGVWSQAIMYFFFSVSAIFFPKFVIKKFGTKTTYYFSMIAYIPYIASNFYSHWVLVVPVSILIGLGAALIWGAQASYLNNVSIMYVDIGLDNKREKESEKNISTISDSIVPWNSGKKDNRSVSCDIESSKPYFESYENNVILKSYENYWLKRNSIATIVPAGCYSNAISQEDETEDSSSTNNQFSLPVPLRSDKYYNVLENNEMNHKAEEVAKINESVKRRRKMIESTTARFFGFHGVAYLTCHLWGNLITYFILQTDVDMDSASNSSCVCGAGFCNVASECFEQNIEQPSERIRYILTGTCVAIGVVAVLIVVFFLDPLESEEKEEVTFSMDLLMATYKLAKKKELILLMPASFYIGMVQGYYTGDFTKSFVGCAWGTYHVGLVAVAYGATCGLSSFSSGWLVKRVGRVPIFGAASLVNVAACVAMLAWRPSAEEPAMFFVIAGMWGVHVGAVWSQLRAFYGILFKADEEAAFAAFHVWYALGFSLSFAYANYFCTYAKIYVLIVVCTLGFIGYLTVEILRFKNKNTK